MSEEEREGNLGENKEKTDKENSIVLKVFEGEIEDQGDVSWDQVRLGQRTRPWSGWGPACTGYFQRWLLLVFLSMEQ